MDFDWKKTLPFIGAIATGGVPALIAAAASAVGEALGTPVEPTPEGVDAAIKSATPEQLIAIKTVDANLKIRFRELDTEDKKIAASVEVASIADTSDARKYNANTDGILYLGYFINFASYFCIFSILYGCFSVLMGTKIAIDPGLAAMVGSVVGAVVQWLMSNSSQANGFFYGSSPSSRQVASDLAKSVSNAVK